MACKLISLNIDRTTSKREKKEWWLNRKERTIKFLQYESPNLLCLQEAEEENISDILLNNKMLRVYRGEGIVDFKQKIYCPIFFDDAINISSKGSVVFEDLEGKKYILTYIFFRGNYTQIESFLFNAQLDSTNTKSRKYISLKMLKFIENKLQNKIKQVILAGDFNSRIYTPHIDRHEFPVIDKFLPRDNLLSLYKKYGYINLLEISEQKYFNTYHDYWGSYFPQIPLAIDWIAIKNPIMNIEDYLIEIKRGIILSDHYPLILTFGFKDNIKKLLSSIVNNTLLYNNSYLINKITNFILECAERVNRTNNCIIDLLCDIGKKYGYKEIVKYLKLCRKKEISENINSISGYERFWEQKYNIVGRQNCFEIITKDKVVDFIKKINVEEFYSEQYDYTTINCCIQNGIIKKFIYNGQEYIIKKNNVLKPQSLENEMKIYEYICKNNSEKMAVISSGAKVRITKPLIVIEDVVSTNKYMVMKKIEGKGLDEILFNGVTPEKRFEILGNLKKISEFFFDVNVLWNDMSPRNIIVNYEDGTTVFNIIDFEKSEILDNITSDIKLKYYRGQVCAEELCSMFPTREVEKIFREYFYLREWDFNSDEVVNEALRPEVALVLQGRNKKEYTWKEYNYCDKEMIETFEPQVDKSGKCVYFPGRLKFKIEHYMNCLGSLKGKEYEQKLTEIVIYAKKNNKLYIITLLEEQMENLEQNLILEECRNLFFESGINSNIKDNISNIIERLYNELILKNNY